MSKKKVKLAVIRKNDGNICPFGLRVPWACQNVGSTVEHMAPLEVLGDQATDREKEMLSKANLKLAVYKLAGGVEGGQCPYASHIFPEKGAVDCNYGDTAPGQRQGAALLGSPFYSRLFAGIGLDGLYSYPLGWLGDYGISRNTYYGIYNIETSLKPELIKIAINIIHERYSAENGLWDESTNKSE